MKSIDRYRGDLELTDEEALSRLSQSSVALSYDYKQLLWTEAHRVDVLIYEFEIVKDSNSEVSLIEPGRLPPSSHLSAMGIEEHIFRFPN